MPRVEVANAHSLKIQRGDIYVGRPSRWGNPFKVTSTRTREEAIDLYREWIAERPERIEQLRRLNPKRLVCWCAPKPCHADVLVELLDV